MSALLRQHCPSDDDFREDAIERVAEGLVSDGEVGALVCDLLAASNSLLVMMGKQPPAWWQSELTTFAQRLRWLDKAIAGATDDLRRADISSLTP